MQIVLSSIRTNTIKQKQNTRNALGSRELAKVVAITARKSDAPLILWSKRRSALLN